ncbi:hypothetical protein L7F22_011197 [Adiantum nelumboides]|nr:hypothetical protein [Adiantum nelumboides]
MSSFQDRYSGCSHLLSFVFRGYLHADLAVGCVVAAAAPDGAYTAVLDDDACGAALDDEAHVHAPGDACEDALDGAYEDALEGADDDEDDGAPLEGAAYVNEADGGKEGRPLVFAGRRAAVCGHQNFDEAHADDDVGPIGDGGGNLRRRGRRCGARMHCQPYLRPRGRPSIHTEEKFCKLNFWKRCCASSHHGVSRWKHRRK